jgi:hypothetical protein
MTQDEIISAAWSMSEGYCFRFTDRDFKDAFPINGWFLGDQRPPEDRLLENLPGVNYGAYKLDQDIISRDWTLCRYPCGKHKVREDWDRRQLTTPIERKK